MKSFEVKGKVFRWSGDASSWHFVYIPEKLSRQIKDTARAKKPGVPFVKIKATIGKTSWNTSLFPTRDGPYLIAIKADARHKEGIDEGDVVKIDCVVI